MRDRPATTSGRTQQCRWKWSEHWSEHVKSVVGTDLCEAPPQQYHVTGRIQFVMQDGTGAEAGPGDITSLPPGHDAWVVGDEPVVAIDWEGASVWARPYPG